MISILHLTCPRMALLPLDQFIKVQAFTRATHRDVYSAIDPAQDKLSQAGKFIVVTRTSRGIGERVGLSKNRYPRRCPKMSDSEPQGFAVQFARANRKAIVH